MSNQTQSPHDAASCFAVATTKDIPDNLRGNRDCGCIRGYARKSRRESVPPQRDTDVGKKSSPGKDRKKRRRLDERFPVPSRFSETASRTRRERRNTRPLTWHTKRRQAEHLAAFRETEERRCRESRVATRCCSRKVKKKALSSTSARAICARRHTARHARPAETHESTRPRAHVRPASRQRLAQAGPRPAGELRETRSSDEPTRACGYFFEP